MALTSADLFAEKGNPLATPADWQRELEIASAPMADTQDRESALAYVRPTRPYVAPHVAPQQPRKARSLPDELVNLKQILSAIGAQERTIVPAREPERKATRVLSAQEELRYRAQLEKPEPASYPVPKPLGGTPEESKAKRRAHNDWIIAQFEKSLALREKLA